MKFFYFAFVILIMLGVSLKDLTRIEQSDAYKFVATLLGLDIVIICFVWFIMLIKWIWNNC